MIHGQEALFFTKPSNPKQRLYEALRAIFVEKLATKKVAALFGYTVNTLYVLASHFRAGKIGPFFIEGKPGPKTKPKRDPVRSLVVQLRKRNSSIYDISRLLKEKKQPLSPRSVWEILKEEGFARLPRRLENELPDKPKPEPAPKADRRVLRLSPGLTLRSPAAGLFLFLPDLLSLNLPRHIEEAGYPGTKAIPPLQYLLSLLSLKLLCKERYSHVMDCCHDLGNDTWASLPVSMPSQRPPP